MSTNSDTDLQISRLKQENSDLRKRIRKMDYALQFYHKSHEFFIKVLAEIDDENPNT